jgi:hypothetical protein
MQLTCHELPRHAGAFPSDGSNRASRRHNAGFAVGNRISKPWDECSIEQKQFTKCIQSVKPVAILRTVRMAPIRRERQAERSYLAFDHLKMMR